MSNYFMGTYRTQSQTGKGKVHVIIGTFADLARHVRENEDFEPKDYVIINVEIDY